MTTDTLFSTPLAWCAFEDITCGTQAASAAAACAYSLSTLQVASCSEAPGFAITEHVAPEKWRWAVIGPGGEVVEAGCRPTLEAARSAATDALYRGKIQMA
jgi:hypothetical protein